MKKIIFGITGLTLGGAERVLVDLANKLSEKYDITIFTIYGKGELEKRLNPKIHLINMFNFRYDELTNKQKKEIPLKLFLFKKYYYNKFIKKGSYDIEVAFLEGPITRFFSIKNKNTRKIVWVHNDISKVFGKDLKSKLKIKFDRKMYEKYQTIIFVSQDNKKKFEEVYPDLRNEFLEPIHKRVVYNYINPDEVIRLSKDCNEINQIKELETKEIPVFVQVSRLTEQKGIDRIIKVHKKLLQKGLKHEWYIIGTGPEEDNLKEIIKDEKVGKTFHLLGKRENPYPYMKASTFVTLLSRFEGYGMVLEEAKILNKPIIITDTAAREALKNYDNSKILQNTEDGIYEGLKEILKKKIYQFDKNEKAGNTRQYDNSRNYEKVIKIFEEK